MRLLKRLCLGIQLEKAPEFFFNFLKNKLDEEHKAPRDTLKLSDVLTLSMQLQQLFSSSK